MTSIDEFFFFENKGALMPVWVRGNAAGGTFLIILHGGPGGSAMDYAMLDNAIKENIEDRYAVTYWDQRASGNSQGNVDESTLTVDQFTEDLNHLVTLLGFRYDDPEIFLLGHSWGGTLGTAYLINTNYQKGISGWIEVDGGHNIPLGYKLQRDFVMSKASNFISDGEDTQKWTDVLNWCYTNTNITTEDRKGKIWGYMEDAGGSNNYSNNSPTLKELFTYYCQSPNNLFTATMNQNTMPGFDEKVEVALSSEMYRITIPVLILWGLHDGICPVGLADDAYNSVGTVVSDKYMVIFTNSGHSPMIDEPEKFVSEVNTFIEKYR